MGSFIDRLSVRMPRRARVLSAFVILIGLSLLFHPVLQSQDTAHAQPGVPAGLSASDWSSLQAMLPPSQQAYVKAANSQANDIFGVSVAVDGDTVVIGAPREDSSTTVVNSTPNEAASDAGAVYVFVRTGTTWTQQAYLKASNAEENDSFGERVAVDGDTVVVGAPGEDSAAIGVDGNQNDNSANLAGAAYVFTRSNGVWTQQAYLKASNTGAHDLFSISVAISANTIVVGSRFEASAATGVDGNQSDNSADGAGAAYAFVRSGTTWTQQVYLKASNTGAGDAFGYSVAVEGDTIVVGAGGEASGTTGINSTPNESAAYAGAAYVFARSGAQGAPTWVQQAYLKASNTEAGDSFGASVAISAETIVIGSPSEYSAATGVNGDQSDNSANGAGAAYVFVRSGAQGAPAWTQQAYLKASNTGIGDSFGCSVAVEGNTVVVGAMQESSAATGVNGDGSDDSIPHSGAAYTFTRSGTTWSGPDYLKASNTGWADDFGSTVGVDGDTVVVGSLWEDSSASGVNGDQDNNNAPDAGAAYILSAAVRSARYMPLLAVDRRWLVAINAQAIPTRTVTTAGQTYYTTTIALPAPLPAGGHFYFSSAPDSVQPIKVDDELVVTVNGQQRLVAFATYPLVVEVQRAEITQWLGQNVVVSFRDKYGSVVGSTPVWLIWAP